MKTFVKIFFKYSIVTFFAFLFDCIFNEIEDDTIYNLIENILFSIILVCPHLIISNERLNKLFFTVSYIIFSLSVCFETIYYNLFETTFSSSVIFVVLDTNYEESKEFISFYLNSEISFLIIIILTTVIITLFCLKSKDFLIKKSNKAFRAKVFGLFFGLIVFLKLSLLIIYNLPYMTIRASIEYFIESKKLSNYANDKNGNFKDVSRSCDIQKQEVYVIIIGESTARGHLGIYGYYRNTTPLLEEIKNELLIYNNVISPDTYTIASLTKVLTLGNYENPEAKFDGSIIQLLNQAKFKTYWVSAQRPAGANDSQITNLGLGADESYFLNIKPAQEKTIYDEVLLEKLNTILGEKGNKKVIFLHTLGTHFNYKYRYPERFDFFKDDIPKSKFKKQAIYNEINAYDNAVRYTDYILSSVIKKVKKVNTNSCVLYFSDHGEEVYDDIEFSGHFRDKIQTKNVYEIPLILWRSESYKKGKTIYPHLDSKYMIDDLFHSIADLLDIKASEVDSARSIFSEHFKERKRIVKDTVDYDNFFK